MESGGIRKWDLFAAGRRRRSRVFVIGDKNVVQLHLFSPTEQIPRLCFSVQRNVRQVVWNKGVAKKKMLKNKMWHLGSTMATFS